MVLQLPKDMYTESYACKIENNVLWLMIRSSKNLSKSFRTYKSYFGNAVYLIGSFEGYKPGNKKNICR